MNKGSKEFESGWKVSCEWENEPIYICCIVMNCSGEHVLEGSVKWDGCSNWSEPNGNQFHLCGIKDLANLTECLGFCYDFAQSKMPEAYG